MKNQVALSRGCGGDACRPIRIVPLHTIAVTFAEAKRLYGAFALSHAAK
jgi:hypothetical protein